ncbi:hypothetical protein Hanom_Chr02g00167731 [Helianthus anomalus]
MCPIVPHSKHDLRSTNPEVSCGRLANDDELCEPEICFETFQFCPFPSISQS